MDNQHIREALSSNGIQSAEVRGTDGGSILVISAGARVLRLTGKSGCDFLWLNELLRADDPQGFFETSGWLNFGGDRTWLGPERSTHIVDLNDPWGSLEVPKAVDPGQYQIEQVGSELRVAGRLRPIDHRAGAQADLAIEKTIVPAANPFRYVEDAEHILAAEYIGYEQTTTLTMRSVPKPGMHFDLWQLAQVAAPGELLAPVTDGVQPFTYFGPTGSSRMRMEPGMVRFQVGGGKMHKIGIKAASTTGRAGFLRDGGDGSWSLLVRSYQVNPSAEYVDVPWDDPDDRGYALQFFADGGCGGNFGELEYHTPGVGDGAGAMSYTDRSQLWAFRAEYNVIQEIARRLLNIDLWEAPH